MGNENRVDDEDAPLLSVQDEDDRVPIRCTSWSPPVVGDDCSPIIRRPYHYSYNGSEANADIDDLASYQRYRYYQRLAAFSANLLRIPDHVLPSSFLYQLSSKLVEPSGEKQSSIVTIFAIWNTMLGTSVLSMPWAIEQAGFTCGLIIMLAMAGLCFYTAYRVLMLQENSGLELADAEFPDLCRILLGRWAEWTSVFFSLCGLVGPIIVYWVLMTNFLYNTVTFIYNSASSTHSATVTNVSYPDVFCPKGTPSSPNSSSYNYDDALLTTSEDQFSKIWNIEKTVPFFLIILVAPLVNFRSATFFTKFNALGTISVLFIISFIAAKAGIWGIHIDFHNVNALDYIPQYRSSFPALTGLLALSYFIHNCIGSIVKNQRNPANNGRDLFIAYCLVAATYIFIAVMFYISFPLRKNCIEDNLLNNFQNSDVLTFVARIFLLLQIISVFPLLMYIIRVQLLYQLFGTRDPTIKWYLPLNIVLISIAVIFSIYLPHIGTIIRFTGAFCGLAYNFALPCLAYMAALRLRQQLTIFTIVVHSAIILIGIVNFVAQFFIISEESSSS